MGLDHLIIFLPGIGGSVLSTSADTDAKIVWDQGKRSIGRLALRSDQLDLDRPLTPTGLTTATKFLGFTVVGGYATLLEELAKIGKVDPGHPARPVLDADIVAVPYDFRQSVVDAAERLDCVVRTRLDGLSEAERTRRVIVVAHSLGGLVARAWLGLPQLARWPWCRALITVGTPHRGAPKALQWTVDGAPLGLPGPTRLIRAWPSVAELLPRYRMIRDTRVDDTRPGAFCYPHELDLEVLGKRAADAFAVHEAIRSAWEEMPRSGPVMHTCLGWPHPTPSSAFWDGARLQVRTDAPPWLPAKGWDLDVGDGTVPGPAAVPLEQDDDAGSPRRLPDKHIALASSTAVIGLLSRYVDVGSLRKYRRPAPDKHPPSLGVDLDEIHLAGSSMPIRVAPRQTDPDLGGQPVAVRIAAADGSVSAVVLDRDAAGYRGELPPQPPGLYEVEVLARAVPGAGDLSSSETIAVVDEAAGA